MLAPWKKSYDQPRQQIKKQRHYFANKSPSCQSCGFLENQKGRVGLLGLTTKERKTIKEKWYYK